MVVTLVLLLSACSPTYNSFIGTHQEKPFEVQINKSPDQVWASFEKIFKDEQIPIHWKDRTGGVITSKAISFADSYSIENEDGQIDDPSARMVVARVMNGSSVIEPKEITGKWNLRVRTMNDNLSMVNVTLLTPKAHNTVNGQKTNLDIRSSGVFEKKVYAMLMGKSLKELEKTMPNPTPTEKKEVVAPPPTPVTKKEMATTEAAKPMAQESPIAGQPEIKKPEAQPAQIKPVQEMERKVENTASTAPATNDVADTNAASSVAATKTKASEDNTTSVEVANLQKQVQAQQAVIIDQRNQLADLRNKQNTSTPQAVNHQSQGNYDNSRSTNYNSKQYAIQFIAITHSNEQFSELTDLGELVVEKVPNKSLYRYKIGHFNSKLDANRALVQIRNRGYSDAFIN